MKKKRNLKLAPVYLAAALCLLGAPRSLALASQTGSVEEEGEQQEQCQAPVFQKITKNAFAKSKAKKLVLKTKLLTKKSVKGSLKKSKVKTIQVKAGTKKENKKLKKAYKKIFTKKNAGRKAKVK